MSVYDDIPVELPKHIDPGAESGELPVDAQDMYVEKREPAELIFCVILAAAYAGFAQNACAALQTGWLWDNFIYACLYITLSLLSLMLGIRPYLSPSSLQISNLGLKYQGPFWPQRKSMTWEQLYRLYLSPDMIVVLYHPSTKVRSVRFLFIQCNYLSDRDQLLARFSKYAPVPTVVLRNPPWYLKMIFLVGYLSLVCSILYWIVLSTHK